MKKTSIRRMSILFAMAFIMAMAIVPVNAMSLTMAPPVVTLDCCDYCAAEEAEEARVCWGFVIFIGYSSFTCSSFCRTCGWNFFFVVRMYQCLDCGLVNQEAVSRGCGC